MANSIRKIELSKYDDYLGTAKDLIAAGHLRTDQLPPPGRWRISYIKGIEVRGNHKFDETYLRVELLQDGQVRVRKGVATQEQRARRTARQAADELERKETFERRKRRASLGRLFFVPAYDVREEGFNFQRRLANIEALCRCSLAAVTLKKGESAKLARAEEDLIVAIADLERLRTACAHGQQDEVAIRIAIAGKAFADNYVKCSKPQ